MTDRIHRTLALNSSWTLAVNNVLQQLVVSQFSPCGCRCADLLGSPMRSPRNSHRRCEESGHKLAGDCNSTLGFVPADTVGEQSGALANPGRRLSRLTRGATGTAGLPDRHRENPRDQASILLRCDPVEAGPQRTFAALQRVNANGGTADIADAEKQHWSGRCQSDFLDQRLIVVACARAVDALRYWPLLQQVVRRRVQ